MQCVAVEVRCVAVCCSVLQRVTVPVTWSIHLRATTHSSLCHDSFICVTWLIRTRDNAYSYVWHKSLTCVPWLIHKCAMTHSYVWHDSFVHGTMRDKTYSHVCHDSYIRATPYLYVCHDSFICVTWLIHMCGMTHSSVWHDLFTCVAWLIHLCDKTYSHVWHDSFIRIPRLIHTCAMTHSSVWYDFFICISWKSWQTWLLSPGDRVCVRRLFRSHSHMRAMTCSYVCHDSFLQAIRRVIGVWDTFLDLIHTYVMRAMTRLFVWRDSFICVPWLLSLGDRACNGSVRRLFRTHRAWQLTGENSQKSALQSIYIVHLARSWLLRIYTCDRARQLTGKNSQKSAGSWMYYSSWMYYINQL